MDGVTVCAMGSLAQATVDVKLSPFDASQALVPVLTDSGFTLADDAVPGAAEVAFIQPRSMMRGELWGLAKFTQTETGSSIEIGIDTGPNDPKALLDGRRNRKTVAELAEKVTAELGSA